MILFKLLSWLTGYIVIVVPEHCLEKFANLAADRGIMLWDISNIGSRQVLLKVNLQDVQPLRHVAGITHCRFKIIGQAGLPFVWVRMKKRQALLAGGLIFVIALYLLSSFVWLVEVTGNKNLAADAVKQAAEDAGLRRGAFKFSLNTKQMEEQILRRLPELSWVGIQLDGTRVNIEVVEKVLPLKDGEGKLVDVVAVKDGLVKEILVLSGYPLVQEGDSVSTGQVLISAASPPQEDQWLQESLEEDEQAHLDQSLEHGLVQYVDARGFIRARVWYEGYGEMPLMEKGIVTTGRERVKMSIKIGAKEIILMGPREAPYQDYDQRAAVKKMPAWRNLKLPVEFITVKYYEKEQYIKNHSPEQAQHLAQEQALANVEAQLPAGAKILHRQSAVVDTLSSDGLVRVRVMVETLEEIGVEKPCRELESQESAKEVTGLL